MSCDIAKMSQCFWCGGEKNELIIAKRQDKQWCDNKTMSVIANYEPCDKCKEGFAKGVQLIEAQEEPLWRKQPEIQKGVYPTGNTWVINREVAEEILGVKNDIVFIDKEMAEKIGLYQTQEEGA